MQTNSLSLFDAWDASFQAFFSKNIGSKTDKSFWKNHIQPVLGDTPLTDITTAQLLKLRIELENKKLSPQTVHHCLALIRRIFNKSYLLGLHDLQTPKFIMPKLNNGRVRFLSDYELTKLFNALQCSHLWFSISKFALHTGMRAGEIFDLKCAHINFQQNGIHIFDTKSCNRFVPLNETSKQIALDFYTEPNSFLFSNNGKRLIEVNKIFRQAVDSAELNDGITDRRQKVVFHTLRHTFASRLVQNGKTIEVVSKLLGHSSLQMTMRYAHLSRGQFFDAVNSLDHVPSEHKAIYVS